MKQMRSNAWVVNWIGIGGVIVGSCAIAPATPAQIISDNTLPTPSRVEPGCTVCTIEGGSHQGANLFHSFSEFSLPTGGEAFFNNASQIENIFSRVTGNSISNIDGLIRANGAANLFLINPNGIIFGPNATLDINGSFLASTADSFEFGNGLSFSATLPEAPPLLTVNITPGLQYGADYSQATLTSAGNLAAGQNLLLAAGNLDLRGRLYAGNDLTLHALDTLRVRDQTENPFIVAAGGQLLVQGNQAVDIGALSHPDSGLFSVEDMVLRSNAPVIGDARYWSGGNLRIENLDNQLSALFSADGPIIRTHGDVSFERYTGASLHILAGGSVNIGSLIINNTHALDSIQENVTLSDGVAIVAINGGAQPTLDIRAGSTALGGFQEIQGNPYPTELTTISPRTTVDITIDNIDITRPNGLVFLTNQYQPNIAPRGAIQIGEIHTADSRSPGSGSSEIFIGNSGDVIIDSRDTITFLGGFINTTSSTGRAGDIRVLAENRIWGKEGAFLRGATFGPGRGGDIHVQTGALTLIKAIIATGTAGLGRGGDATIIAPRLILRDGAVINSATIGVGQGGDLTVIASDFVEIVGASFRDPLNSSGLFAISLGAGDAGDLRVETQRLMVRDGGQVGNYTIGPGDAGNLNIIATESVMLLRTLPNFPFATGLLTETVGAGDAGDLRVETQRFIMEDGAGVSSGAFFSDQAGEAQQTLLGQAGNITIIAPELVELSGRSGDRPSNINSETEGHRPGGDLNIETGKLMVRDGAIISTNTFGEGLAGRLTINASEAVTLIGRGPNDTGTGVFSGTGQNSSGNGGSVFLTSPTINVRNGARISVDSQGIGEGGDIQLMADTLILEDNAQILAGTQSNTGGDVTLRLGRLLLMRNGSRISTTAGTAQAGGDGGNITIDAQHGFIVAVPEENSDIRADAFRGRGGNVNITAQGVFGIEPRDDPTELSDITASSEFGVSGAIQISNPDVDPSRGLTELPSTVVDVSRLVTQGCDQSTMTAQESRGEFYNTGRGGVASLPTAVLGSDDILEDLQPPISWRANMSTNSPIVEAQGWLINHAGEVMLVAEPPHLASQPQCWR